MSVLQFVLVQLPQLHWLSVACDSWRLVTGDRVCLDGAKSLWFQQHQSNECTWSISTFSPHLVHKQFWLGFIIPVFTTTLLFVAGNVTVNMNKCVNCVYSSPFTVWVKAVLMNVLSRHCLSSTAWRTLNVNRPPTKIFFQDNQKSSNFIPYFRTVYNFWLSIYYQQTYSSEASLTGYTSEAHKWNFTLDILS